MGCSGSKVPAVKASASVDLNIGNILETTSENAIPPYDKDGSLEEGKTEDDLAGVTKGSPKDDEYTGKVVTPTPPETAKMPSAVNRSNGDSTALNRGTPPVKKSLKAISPRHSVEDLSTRREELLSSVVGTGAVIVAQVWLPVSLREFKRVFWTAGCFYPDFLGFSLGDVDISATPWEASVETLSGRTLKAVHRTVTSKHPHAVSFPGLPTHADSTKTQTLACIGDYQMLVVDTTSFKGFPYSDHFVVVARWVILSHPAGTSLSALPKGSKARAAAESQAASKAAATRAVSFAGGGEAEKEAEAAAAAQAAAAVVGEVLAEDWVEVQIACEVLFRKATILQKRITANTLDELGKTFDSWGRLAEQRVQFERDEKAAVVVAGDSLEVEAFVAHVEASASNEDVDGEAAEMLKDMTVSPEDVDEERPVMFEATELTPNQRTASVSRSRGPAGSRNRAGGAAAAAAGGESSNTKSDGEDGSADENEHKKETEAAVPVESPQNSHHQQPEELLLAKRRAGRVSSARAQALVAAQNAQAVRTQSYSEQGAFWLSSLSEEEAGGGGSGGDGGDGGGSRRGGNAHANALIARLIESYKTPTRAPTTKKTASAAEASNPQLQAQPPQRQGQGPGAFFGTLPLNPYFALDLDLDATAADVEGRHAVLVKLVEAWLEAKLARRGDRPDKGGGVVVRGKRGGGGGGGGGGAAAEKEGGEEGKAEEAKRVLKQAAKELAAEKAREMEVASQEAGEEAGLRFDENVQQADQLEGLRTNGKNKNNKNSEGKTFASGGDDLASEVVGTASYFMNEFTDSVAGAASTVLEEMSEVSEVAKTAQDALSNPDDPSSRRVLAGMVAGATLGTLITLNPVGGIIGGLVGAGAGAGVHEVSKEVSLGRTVKDSSLASLPGRRLLLVLQATEDQGKLPVASSHAAVVAAGGGGSGSGSGGSGASGGGSGGGDGGVSAWGGSLSEMVMVGSGLGGAEKSSEDGGSGDSGASTAVGASDVLIYSVLAASKADDGDNGNNASGTAVADRFTTSVDDNGDAAATFSQSSSGGAVVSASSQARYDDGAGSSMVSFVSDSFSAVTSFSPFGDSDSSSTTDRSKDGGGWSGTQLAYNVVNRRYYTSWGIPKKPSIVKTAAGGGSEKSGGQLASLEPKWAIWTREMLSFVHRYEYATELEAKAEFERWVYVRILTDPSHEEVDARGGWHAAPEGPLRDIRSTIETNR